MIPLTSKGKANPGHLTFIFLDILLASLLVTAGGLYCSYVLDNSKLKEIGSAVTMNITSNPEKVIKLLDWIYHNKVFGKNRDYLIFKSLGATPVSVLEKGGDCADKSKLMWSILDQIGINSTMIVLYDPKTGKPVHTVIEAEYSPGKRMIVDPVYNLFFPKGNIEYYGLIEMRKDAKILEDRVTYLRSKAKAEDKINRYHLHSSTYHFATSMNWRKNPFTRLLFRVLYPYYGDNIYVIKRPAFLERPKMFLVFILCFVIINSFVIRIVSKRHLPTKSCILLETIFRKLK